MKKRKSEKDSGLIKKFIIFVLLTICLLLIINILLQEKTDRTLSDNQENPSADNTVQNSTETILKEGEGVEIVRTHCTSCHSAQLIVQNRATREGWLSMIRWMQQTQNLWDLGEHEEIILNYLSTHYPPEEKGRRENLKDIEWYELNEQSKMSSE